MSEKEVKKEIIVNIDESQTITELSQVINPFKSEIYLKKNVNGSIYDINLKSFLGLINLRLSNGDKILVRAVGEDCEAAAAKVIDYLT
ncbi:HPr family phosphocarrier protein [Bacillus sp. Marseille-P3661]|uniref:HPr family phosphocarrier protein n=1 Tax=Bacillus sp. Marseille-P3661 TaxID=1936234 RepID=UPI000C83F88B|nr:HPr family phosphocarrier protein [Bacillus sp. Marseille-P3661]